METTDDSSDGQERQQLKMLLAFSSKDAKVPKVQTIRTARGWVVKEEPRIKIQKELLDSAKAYIMEDKRFTEDANNGEIVVREYVNEDLPVLSNLDIVVNDEMSTRMFGEEIFEKMCNIPREKYKDYRTLVATRNDIQIGFAIFYKNLKSSKHVELFWLLVHPFHRRKGIGLSLLKKMRQACIDEFPECEKIKLHVNERNGNAKSLYEKIGFTLKGTKHDYPELGETSHRMEMEIYNDDDDDDDMSVCSTSSSSDDDDDDD